MKFEYQNGCPEDMQIFGLKIYQINTGDNLPVEGIISWRPRTNNIPLDIIAGAGLQELKFKIDGHQFHLKNIVWRAPMPMFNCDEEETHIESSFSALGS